MFNHQVNGVIVAVGLTAISYGIGLAFGWTYDINWLEVFSVFTSYWCTYLCVFQSRWNYPIGAISVAALCLLFYKSNLLSSMALQIYLFPTLALGWWWWHDDTITRPVTFVGWRWYPVYIGMTAIVGYLCMFANTKFGGTNGGWDTTVLVLSILAQFLMDRKKLENWLIWIAVDVISVPLYWSQGLNILAIQMGLFGINAVWGLYMWWKTYKGPEYLNWVYQFPTYTISQETYK